MFLSALVAKMTLYYYPVLKKTELETSGNVNFMTSRELGSKLDPDYMSVYVSYYFTFFENNSVVVFLFIFLLYCLCGLFSFCFSFSFVYVFLYLFHALICIVYVFHLHVVCSSKLANDITTFTDFFSLELITLSNVQPPSTSP